MSLSVFSLNHSIYIQVNYRPSLRDAWEKRHLGTGCLLLLLNTPSIGPTQDVRLAPTTHDPPSSPTEFPFSDPCCPSVRGIPILLSCVFSRSPCPQSSQLRSGRWNVCVGRGGVEALCHSLFQQRARVWVERRLGEKTINKEKNKSTFTSKRNSKIQNGPPSPEQNSPINPRTQFILPKNRGGCSLSLGSPVPFYHLPSSRSIWALSSVPPPWSLLWLVPNTNLILTSQPPVCTGSHTHTLPKALWGWPLPGQGRLKHEGHPGREGGGGERCWG